MIWRIVAVLCRLYYVYCGISHFSPNIAGRIVSGNEARPHSWPWQVSLQVKIPLGSRSFSHVCGGTLVHKNWIYSKTHIKDTGNWRIVLGKHNLNRTEKTEKVYRVKRIYRHERFRYPTLNELDYDIALVRSATDIPQSNFIRYACMPTKASVLKPGHHCWTTGWGDTRGTYPNLNEDNVTLSEVLNQAKLPVIDHHTCKLKKYWGDRVRKTMICAGFKDTEGHPAACQGDSGGPLLCQIHSDKWEVHGVVSFGPIGCTVENKPSVFTRIITYIPWMETTKIRDYFLH
uniref:Zgc:112285 n=1 Tax=Callorhinchus milii TaxID=7868 RepID=A0A4W3I142_CALMI